ncbi:MAG: hypothetical protein LUD47_03125 [Clostridia bacterium]|nr:hypothetical protein [Clostridia bacterium]
MAYDRVTVKVTGNDTNRKLFKSILTLCENEKQNCGDGTPFYGNISNDYTRTISIGDVSETSITFRISSGDDTTDRTYVLSDDLEASGLKIGFDREGATWFGKLRRGETLESPDSDWAGMRDLIAAAYHRKYYSVEFYVNDKVSDTSYRRECVDFVYAIGELMREGLGCKSEEVFDIDTANLKNATDTYYRAKLRVDATLGVGQPMPLICYMYYRYEAATGDLTLMARSVAEQIDAAIKTNLSMKKGDRNDARYEQDLDVTNRLIKIKLDEDLNGDMGEANFNRSRFLTQSSREALAKGQTTGVGDEIHLDCKSIKLLSVAKVNWPTIKFRVTYEHQDVYELNYNINGITLTCVNCGTDAVLVENDCIKFPKGKEPAFPVSVYGTDEDGMPVKDRESTKNRLLALRENGHLDDCVLMRHLTVTPTCNRAASMSADGKAGCLRLVCEPQLINFGGEDGEETRLCRNCGYAEIVYKDPYDFTSKPTANLFHDVVSSRMVEKTGERKCRMCGLSYGQLKNGYCDTCYKAMNEKEDNGLYKVYKNVLPLTVRTAASHSRHVCFENSAIIVFGVGNNLYRFDKLDINDKGYIKPAVKLTGKNRK